MKSLAQILAFIALCSSSAFALDYSGKVLTPDGKPVKDATVYLLPVSHPNPANAQPTTRPDFATTRTDESGTYHFTNANGQLIATADGYGFNVPSNGNNANGVTDIRLTSGTDLTLTFVNPDGSPAAHVPIYLRSVYWQQTAEMQFRGFNVGDNARSLIAATTDDHGQCSFPGFPQGATASFGVDDETYAQPTYRNNVLLATGAKTQPDPIHLVLAANISGTATYADSGKPAAGFQVYAQSNDGGYGSVVTAADGTYSIKQLPAGSYNVAIEFTEEQEKSWTAKAAADLATSAGQTKTGVDFSIIGGVVLNGSVLASDDGTPIAGVPVGIYGPAHPRTGGAVQSVNTDAKGQFSVRVPPGEQFVYIMSDTPADGFGRPSPDNKTLTVADGGTGSVEFRLPRVLMAPIKGKVVDPDGNPVAGASVSVSSDQMPMFNRVAFTTDAQGIFQSMPMQRNVKIEVRARFHDMGTAKPVIVPRSGELVVHLDKGAMGTITGRVVGPDGKPLQNASVELIIRAQRYSFGQDAGVTDADGNYKIDSLWPDLIYFVNVSHDGYGQSESAQIRLQPGQPNKIKDLTLYKRDSSIAGMLLDANEKPVTGKRVYVSGGKSGYSNLTTDNDGKFSCAVVSEDHLTVFYNLDSNTPYKRQTVRAGDQKIVLHTSPPKVVPPPIAAAPVHVDVAPAAAAQAAPSEAQPAAPQIVYDPAAAVTWNGWLYAGAMLAIGTLITGISGAIGMLLKRKAV
jgi:uncharacterized GH25 family protein